MQFKFDFTELILNVFISICNLSLLLKMDLCVIMTITFHYITKNSTMSILILLFYKQLLEIILSINNIK